MATWSDGGRSGVINFSSMRQPPLIKQLKRILSEYPDGGQILKELIQNAEDANATVVKIEYDSRRINDEANVTTPKYTKFFKGPALCVYNDAVFSDNDWDGIRMIYSSVKEDDRLKVGRFGLGFKSVFHITDYPCVLSGNNLLMIDPQQPSDMVNAMVSLSRIEQLDDMGLPTAVFLSALDNKFGLTQECVRKGYFKGTIFRFPLRENKSEISETLYNEKKILDLFDDFTSDSSSILVFLKNLDSVSVLVTGENNVSKIFTSVCILDEEGDVRKSRLKFKNRLNELNRNFKEDDIVHEVQMTIRTTIKEITIDTDWVIVNYYVGRNASHGFRTLIEDANFGYSPYVGVACQIARNNVNDFEGHLFCFLPLPKEGAKLTGLPIHVNGYFALSQNRHHLKLETDEQQGKKIDDKSILWNRYLIQEAIPKAYCKLIQKLIGISKDSGNSRRILDTIYHSLPQKTRTSARWQVLETELFTSLKTLPIFYVEHTNSWVTVSEGCFATFSSLSAEFNHVIDAVKRCMNQSGLLLVEAPSAVFETVKYHFKKVKDIGPGLLAKYLHRNDAYKTMNSADKTDVLMYLLSDKNCFEKLNGLELLPLESGNWITFKNTHDTVYLCDEEITTILPGLEHLLVKRMECLGSTLHERISELCNKGSCQIQRLGDEDLVKLVEKCINLHLGETSSVCITHSSKLSVHWLQSVWKYIIKKQIIPIFRDTKIVPKLIGGTWEIPLSIDLIKMRDMVLVSSIPKASINCSIVRCFGKMGVTIIDMLPDWIPMNSVKSFFFWPTVKGILALLEYIQNDTKWQSTIDEFNSTCEYNDRIALVQFFSECYHLMNETVKKLLRKLKIFCSISCISEEGWFSTIDETKHFILDTIKFPENIPLPFSCCLGNSTTERLLTEIGGSKVELQELVIKKLETLHGVTSCDEIAPFMQFIIDNFHLFQMNNEIIKTASRIPFLHAGSKQCTPGELFDPSDPILKDMLYDEDLLPETKSHLSTEYLRILQLLGLKNLRHINTEILLQVARSLDVWSKSADDSKMEYLRKATAFIEFLKRRPSVLHESCNTGNALYKCIGNLECIVIDKNNSHYPQCLTWYRHNNKLCEPTKVKEANLSIFVGASMPVITCTEQELNLVFGWDEQPNLEVVFVQLKTVKKHYSVQSRPDLMPCIKALYDHLFQRVADVRHVMDEDGLIWTGESFQKANVVTIKKEISDLDLTPYIYSIPVEFEIYHDLFDALGCRQNQNIEVLQDALQLVQFSHTSRQDDLIVKRDKRLVCNILDRIAYFIQNGADINIDDVLVMVHNDSKSSLVMYPCSKCAYDDDPDFFYEDTGNMHLVHEMISAETVEILGIKSITKKALLDAEGLSVEEFEQKEHLTTRISSLLRDGYTDGLSVPKELIQNADDAGATTIKFLYDERQNYDAMQRLFSRGMTSFQGPALWVFNDAQFSQYDIENIKKLNGATKRRDVKTIGKFGLGFCSVYNLTDIPSFLTGTNLVYFDPHENHLGKILQNKKAGLKYTLPNRTLITRHVDQFKPYNGIFGCDILAENFEAYPGTLFRLPLRTEQQARESKICPKSYTADEIKALLTMLTRNAGNLLLFSQNIRSIDLYHLSENADPKDAQLIYKVEKESLKSINGLLSPVGKSVLSRVPQILKNDKIFLETHKSTIRQIIPDGKSILLSDLKLQDVPVNNDTTWFTSWAMGYGSSLDMYRKLSAEGAVPLASVAVPCVSAVEITPLKMSTDLPVGFYTNGHIFCFLPLPIKTNLPVHINGCFFVTSDRRQLVSMSEDDKSSPPYQWNQSLLEDALVSAHINLLVTIADGNVNEQYKYHELWPLNCDTFIDPFSSSFYKRIISDNVKVFKGCGTWSCFENVCFLELSVRNSDIGDIAFSLLSHFPPRQNRILIDMPEPVIRNIKAWNFNNQQISSKEIKMKELLLIFLQNIQDPFWDDRSNERILLIATALISTEKNVQVMMQSINCIPTEPNQTLRKPSELVDPHSLLASLFLIDEEVFPLDSPFLRERNCLQELKNLGMCDDVLPTKILVERCKTVQTLSEHCSRCSIDRSKNIIRYLSQYKVRMSLKMESETLQVMSDLFMLPALSKPRKWKFSWKADIEDNTILKPDYKKCKLHCKDEFTSLLLTKPRLVFRQKICDLVGIGFLILNEDLLLTNVSEALNLLSVKDVRHVTVEMIVSQIITLSNEYKEPTQLGELIRLHDLLLSELDQRGQLNESDTVKHLERISTKAVILIGNELLEPTKVAFSVKQECKPYLYRLPTLEQLKRKRLYFALGVKDHFDVETIVKVMDEIRENGDLDIALVNNLLINLDDVISKSKTTFDEIDIYHERIVAPDTKGKLWPTHHLVTENENFQTGIPMKILHPEIAPSLGEKLGVKVKQLRCLEEISCGISFGQREKLVTRIQGLLKAYPCDSSIMKELLQNADDAGATEINFIKDYRSHCCENLFSDTCKTIQGPSLCVFNNSYFTETDIEGIHDLGKGSKSDDPSRTGQYGVGFNAVYHITDTPSFVTVGPGVSNDGLLFILDPLCKYVPKATRLEPGIMCQVTEVKANFPGQLLGFSLDELIGEKTGTVFRFPLRCQQSEICKNTVCKGDMDGIIELFEHDMLDSMLFLKSIKRITVSNITTGRLVEEYSVELKLSDVDLIKKKCFTDDIRRRCKENSEHKDRLLNTDPIELIYPLKVYVNGVFAKSWLIIQRFGIENNGSDLNNVKKSFRIGDLGLSPIGGVAIPVPLRHLLDCTAVSEINELDNKDSQVRRPLSGRAFCFLPLPIHTGLPVHVNGHFALDHESRRDLWTEGFRMEWNKCVIEHIVIAAWASGLKFIARTISPLVVKSKEWKIVNEEVGAYHQLFPLLHVTSGRFWKYVASTFYKYIVDNEVRVFPSILKRNIGNLCENKMPGNFDVSWEMVSRNTNGDYKGVFNCIPELRVKNNSLRWYHNECFRLENILKKIGLKLLHSPMSIMQSITASGIQMSNSATPELIIAFLHTYSDHNHSDEACDIGPTDRTISDTKYETAENLKILLQFLLLDPKFFDKITGLPVILTADGVLRKCCAEYPVFISKFSCLLPGSSKLFLHSKFQILFPSGVKLWNTGCFKPLTFDLFIELLPISMSPDIYASGREVSVSKDENRKSVDSLAMSWFCKFYEYMCNVSKYTDDVIVDPDKLLCNMQSLNDWSFLPIINSSREEVLVPISKAKNILHLPEKSSHDDVRCILQKLEIPRINVNLLRECSEWNTLNKYIPTYVCSLDQPYRLMKCLLNYQEVVTTRITTCEEGIELLDYFGTSIDILKRECPELELSKELRQLPLYTTVQGTLTALDNGNEILLLPGSIPKDGIQEWANACNVTLLPERYFNERIRKFLGLKKADIYHIYGEKILPNILALPDTCIGTHVQYLRDIICRNHSLTPIQRKIIKCLSEIAFINVNGVMRRANDLYNPKNELFKLMFTKYKFPPRQFLTDEWMAFLNMLGLTSELTDELLLHFARTIEAQRKCLLNDCICLKSYTILKEFTADLSNWSEHTLYQLKTIQFIAPFKEKCENTLICPQLNNASQLIGFKGSVSSIHSSLCWSSSNIIPENVVNKLNKKVKNQLEILERPTVESVLLHCQNVCQYLKEKAKVRSKEFIENLMTPFYEFFRLNTNIDLSGLVNVHFVHLPDEAELVSVSDVVIDLPKDSEIQPYLFRAPKYYGKYHDLFEVLGSKKQAMFCHFARILSKIHCASVDRELSPPERSFVNKALRGLFKLDISNDDTASGVQHIYLPDENMMLKDSKTIVLPDNQRMLNRLKGKVKMHLFAGESFLEMKNLCFEETFQKWPSHLKPLVLTDLVTEQLCLKDSDTLPPDSIHFRSIERFMRSRYLLMAICRLIKHQHLSDSSNKKIKYDAEYYEKEISRRFCSVQIIRMSSLLTILKYNGTIIPGSEADIPFHIEYDEYDSETPSKFFFVDRDNESDNWTFQIHPGLVKLVQGCAKIRLEPNSILSIQMMLNQIESPSRFSEILDMHNIKSYDSSMRNEYFPEPGTYVERHFIPFLEQAIKPFAEYEYDNVAMELEDIPIDEEIDTLFIYVKIIEEVPVTGTFNLHTSNDLRKMYYVDTGNKNMLMERIPIYRLYRFVRRKAEPGALEKVCAVAGDTKPFDRQCSILKQVLIQAWKLPQVERKKIFRRMLLTWHPDKNLNNREYCSKVFHFLKIIYSRLENGEIFVESVEEEIFRGPSRSSQSTEEFYRDVNRRATKQAQAYYDNYDEYSMPKSGGRFLHRTGTMPTAKQSDVMEANRWLRQAKCDFNAAEAFLSCAADVQAFNWICKICHQACETALKAAQYFNDRLSVPGMTRQLRYLAPNIQLVQQAQLLDDRFGEPARLTYPDTQSRPNIPANIFDKADAEYALSTTKEILTMVDDLIS